ncbi:hypothetical protein NDU88_007376 [Pleurodeles waltl]|uniref:Uncharacterized protein n=1 Tax=Pleurodeles waltl TaxID=8319 RepID=A0AAV7PTV5_PLEWA|nr:hypothetical protein NDU88_007376 [Pleurodeles waltl]
MQHLAVARGPDTPLAGHAVEPQGSQQAPSTVRRRLPARQTPGGPPPRAAGPIKQPGKAWAAELGIRSRCHLGHAPCISLFKGTGVEWEQAAERALRSVRRGLSPLSMPMRAHAQRTARSFPIEFSAR